GTLSFSLAGASTTSRVVSGSQVRYAGALGAIDAVYSIIPEGLKEGLVIASKPTSAPVFSFDLSTGSLVLQQVSNGQVQAVDSLGQVQFTIHAPFMHDAPTAQSELGATSDRVAVTLTGAAGL